MNSAETMLYVGGKDALTAFSLPDLTEIFEIETDGEVKGVISISHDQSMILFGTSNKLYLAKSVEATILAEAENEDFTDYKQVGFISESEVFTMVAG